MFQKVKDQSCSTVVENVCETVEVREEVCDDVKEEECTTGQDTTNFHAFFGVAKKVMIRFVRRVPLKRLHFHADFQALGRI